jgi:hypothetical protein
MVSGISVSKVAAAVSTEMLLTKYQHTEYHNPEGYNIYMQLFLYAPSSTGLTCGIRKSIQLNKLQINIATSYVEQFLQLVICSDKHGV